MFLAGQRMQGAGGRAQCPEMAGEPAWGRNLKDAAIRRGHVLKQDGDGIGLPEGDDRQQQHRMGLEQSDHKARGGGTEVVQVPGRYSVPPVKPCRVDREEDLSPETLRRQEQQD